LRIYYELREVEVTRQEYLAACAKDPTLPKPPDEDVGKEKQESAEPATPRPPVRVLSWNIQYGRDQGADLNRWPQRKRVLKTAIEEVKPDILCVQEALHGQVLYMEKLLPDHACVSVGRDDGKAGGEHCPTFFAKRLFDRMDDGTFWLSDTPEKPSRTWGNQYYRICTWAALKYRSDGQKLTVLNTHFPLNAPAREKAARQIVAFLKERGKDEAIILAGDFNCGPSSGPCLLFEQIGLKNAEAASGRRTSTGTYHFSGFSLACIDAIFVSQGFSVREHHMLRRSSGKLYPSDHFGVLAVLEHNLSGEDTTTNPPLPFILLVASPSSRWCFPWPHNGT